MSADSGSVGDPPIDAVAPVEPSPGIDVSPDAPVAVEASPIIEIPVEEFPVVEFPDAVGPSSDSLLDLEPAASPVAAFAPVEDAEPSSQVAEQLAEADVYQKYGLEEKARERLLEVVRLAPDNLTARRRLAAIYRDRRQRDEACGEILAIARLLRKRGQEEAALAEAREGLLLMPGQPDLQQFVAERVEGDAPPAAESAVAAERLGAATGEGQAPEAASVADATADSPLSEASPELWGVVGSADAVGESAEAPAPPAVPSLFEAEETASASAEPRVDLDRILGPRRGRRPAVGTSRALGR